LQRVRQINLQKAHAPNQLIIDIISIRWDKNEKLGKLPGIPKNEKVPHE
jgi:hypothetical protein